MASHLEVVEFARVSCLGRVGPRLRESDEIPWPRWPHMVPTANGFWRLPDTGPRIPLFYSLLGVR